MLRDHYLKCIYAVTLFSQLWRRAIPGKELKPTEYWFPDNADELDTFIKKHDLITDQLDILAARDELLSGKYYMVQWMVCYTIVHDALILHNISHQQDNANRYTQDSSHVSVEQFIEPMIKK